MVTVVMVKVDVAVLMPSVAVMVWLPATPDGVRVTEKVPSAAIVLVATCVPS